MNGMLNDRYTRLPVLPCNHSNILSWSVQLAHTDLIVADFVLWPVINLEPLRIHCFGTVPIGLYHKLYCYRGEFTILGLEPSYGENSLFSFFKFNPMISLIFDLSLLIHVPHLSKKKFLGTTGTDNWCWIRKIRYPCLVPVHNSVQLALHLFS